MLSVLLAPDLHTDRPGSAPTRRESDARQLQAFEENTHGCCWAGAFSTREVPPPRRSVRRPSRRSRTSARRCRSATSPATTVTGDTVKRTATLTALGEDGRGVGDPLAQGALDSHFHIVTPRYGGWGDDHREPHDRGCTRIRTGGLAGCTPRGPRDRRPSALNTPGTGRWLRRRPVSNRFPRCIVELIPPRRRDIRDPGEIDRRRKREFH